MLNRSALATFLKPRCLSPFFAAAALGTMTVPPRAQTQENRGLNTQPVPFPPDIPGHTHPVFDSEAAPPVVVVTPPGGFARPQERVAVLRQGTSLSPAPELPLQAPAWQNDRRYAEMVMDLRTGQII